MKLITRHNTLPSKIHLNQLFPHPKGRSQAQAVASEYTVSDTCCSSAAHHVARMSTLEDLDDLEREGKEEKKDDGDKDKDGKKPDQDGDAEMKDADGEKKEEKDEDIIDTEILHSSTRDIQMRKRLLDNDMRIMKSEYQRLTHEQAAMKEKIKDNLEKIENNR